MNLVISENVLIEKAQNKAILNVLIVPLVLTLATMNILFIIAWWSFIYLLYRFVFPTKQLNKLYFLKYLKVTAITIFFISVFWFVLIII